MNKQSTNRQLAYLFLSSFAILFTGMGLFPVLPLYAARFGASTALIGLYMALTYISITAGTLLTGWLAGRVPARRLFLAAGLAGVPAIIGMGQAGSFAQVVILTAVIWFTGGIGLALIQVFTGLATDPTNRAKAFSLQSLASPAAAMLGGLAVGKLAGWHGYPLMFGVLAVVWAIWPVLALWKITDQAGGDRTHTTRRTEPASKGASPQHAFLALLAAVLLSAVTVSIGRLGLSLVMEAQSFSLGAISSTSMVSGLAAIPIIALTGSAAGRLGQRRLLVLGYLVAAAGTLILIFAGRLWQFNAAATLLLVALNSNRSLAMAAAAELLPKGELARKLPWTATAHWMSGIIGYASAGFVIERLGMQALFSLAAVLSLAAALLVLIPARLRTAARQPVTLMSPVFPQPQICQEG